MTTWVNKLNLEVVEDNDGSCVIHIEWDDKDPDLAEWTSWGEEGQKSFVLDALQTAIDNALTEHDS